MTYERSSPQNKVMQEQTVRSYVRHSHKPEVETQIENNNTMALIILIPAALLLWPITVPTVLAIGTAYGIKTIFQSNARVERVASVTEPENAPQTKRHYEHRIVVNHFQTNKPVRI